MKYSYKKAEREFLRRYFTRVLRAADRRIIPAAKLAQVNRTQLYRILNRIGISPGKISPRKVYSVRPYQTELDEFSRRFFLRALKRCDYSPAATARRMGIDRTHVYRLAARFGVGLLRLKKKNEGNAAWRALGGAATSSTPEADARAPP